MDKRQKQERLILNLLNDSPEQAHWLNPDQMDQAKLNEYERDVWNGIKFKSIIQVGTYDNVFDTKVFRIVATLPQNVKLEKLDEFRENGFTVQFVFPKLDAEEILDNDDGHMVEMITVDYEPTE
jgi:hypothetical protein